jgi:hypothetical protein
MVATLVPLLASSAMKAQMASGAAGQAFRPRAVHQSANRANRSCRPSWWLASAARWRSRGQGELGQRTSGCGAAVGHRESAPSSSGNGSYRKSEPAARRLLATRTGLRYRRNQPWSASYYRRAVVRAGAVEIGESLLVERFRGSQFACAQCSKWAIPRFQKCADPLKSLPKRHNIRKPDPLDLIARQGRNSG